MKKTLKAKPGSFTLPVTKAVYSKEEAVKQAEEHVRTHSSCVLVLEDYKGRWQGWARTYHKGRTGGVINQAFGTGVSKGIRTDTPGVWFTSQLNK